MADISMCMFGACPQSDRCYRFTAQANEHWQAYANFRPDEFGRRANFIDNEPEAETPE